MTINPQQNINEFVEPCSTKNQPSDIYDRWRSRADSALLTLSHIQTLYDASAADSFLKPWQQKEKLLKTSNFSFGHSVFNLFL